MRQVMDGGSDRHGLAGADSGRVTRPFHNLLRRTIARLSRIRST
jgi:hypothetical protein